MTYLDLLNRFWNLFPRQEFSCVETTLYLFLLNEANVSHWADSVQISNSRLFSSIKASPGAIRTARNKLQQLGLIQFKQGNKTEGKTRYWICDAIGSKYDPIIEPIIEPISEPIIGPISEPKIEPLYKNKSKIKKKSEKRNPDGAEVLEAYFDESRRGSLESMAMSLCVGMDELRAIAEECVNDWTLSGETHTDMSEAQKHLTNHIRHKAEAWRQNPAKKPARPVIPRERWAARIERRSETEWVVHQYGDVEPIPVGTPDPPGPTHVWYNGRWVHQ